MAMYTRDGQERLVNALAKKDRWDDMTTEQWVASLVEVPKQQPQRDIDCQLHRTPAISTDLIGTVKDISTYEALAQSEGWDNMTTEEWIWSMLAKANDLVNPKNTIFTAPKALWKPESPTKWVAGSFTNAQNIQEAPDLNLKFQKLLLVGLQVIKKHKRSNREAKRILYLDESKQYLICAKSKAATKVKSFEINDISRIESISLSSFSILSLNVVALTVKLPTPKTRNIMVEELNNLIQFFKRQSRPK
jgi:hypothetical protein